MEIQSLTEKKKNRIEFNREISDVFSETAAFISTFKLFPDIWLVPQLQVCGADFKEHTEGLKNSAMVSAADHSRAYRLAV